MNKPVRVLIDGISPLNRGSAGLFWRELELYLPKTAGSTKAHQAWENGYRDHVQEVMNLAHVLYATLSKERRLEFSLSSALLVLFLHDCEKPFRYAGGEALKNFPWIKTRPSKSDKEFQKRLIKHYGFELSEQEWNGLNYVEGEGDDYVEGERVQGPLAAFCHVCDVISARIWFDHPR